ncbi:helicase polq [Fusarium albosuccineum]|uniref:Helicase polq n=1 Tax=Fusarium albosuccineum TaxID=1237068 RepID=A0A8H4LGB3_9HYPO|nr:helicase polq [Fusarium albosuccineum]
MAQAAEAGGTTVTVHTLAEAMSAPSGPPNVVVLDRDYQESKEEKQPSTTRDLWISSVDGRYSSPPVPVRVGPLNNIQTFYVHRDILTRAEWFRKALCGDFKEAGEQVIDLPEEDPAVFHFLIAFLYEGRFEPIRPAASALEPRVDKGKGLDVDPEPAEASDSSSSGNSSGSDRSSGSPGPGWRQRRRRNRQARNSDADRNPQKQPGLHRPGCRCPRCLARQDFARCWHCGVRRFRDENRPYRAQPPPGRHPPPPIPYGPPPHAQPRADHPTRIMGEDLRTWFLTYELNLDVYICANRFLMDDFRKAVMRSCIDMLETAGTDAALPEVLHLTKRLYRGVPEVDPLLKMVLARVGFLQPLLWKRAPEATSEFLVSNPELAATILRETVMRHDAIRVVGDLPPMEHVGNVSAAYEDERQHLEGEALPPGVFRY